MHGAPVHVGDPAALGIDDLARPDFGEAVTIQPGEVPVFWACGVTPQVALAEAALRIGDHAQPRLHVRHRLARRRSKFRDEPRLRILLTPRRARRP